MKLGKFLGIKQENPPFWKIVLAIIFWIFVIYYGYQAISGLLAGWRI